MPRKNYIVSLALLHVLLTACSDNSSSTDTNNENPDTGTEIIDWQAAKTFLVDINDDGLIDIAKSYTAPSGVAKLSYLENLGSASFSEEVELDNSLPNQINYVKSGNLNSDNKTDISVITSSGIFNYYRDPYNELQPRQEVTDSWSITEQYDKSDNSKVVLPNPEIKNAEYNINFALADITGDGVLDYLWRSYSIPNQNADTVDAYSLIYRAINLGNGQVDVATELGKEATEGDGSSTTRWLLAEDINQDGINELLYGTVSVDGISLEVRTKLQWFEKNDTIKSELLLNPVQPWFYPERIQLVDWDEDQDLDVITWLSERGSSYAESTINLFINYGSAQFSTPESLTQLELIKADTTFDLDKDGKQDFIAYYDRRFPDVKDVIWQRKLTEEVSAPQTLFTYQGELIGLYDLDNDGNIDFVSELDGTLYWYHNQGDLTFIEKTLISTE